VKNDPESKSISPARIAGRDVVEEIVNQVGGWKNGQRAKEWTEFRGSTRSTRAKEQRIGKVAR